MAGSRQIAVLLLGVAAQCGDALSTTPMLQHILGAGMPSGPAVTLVDGNNLRGAELFGVSQRELSELTAAWASAQQLPAVLLLDHGPEERAWRLGTHAALTLCGDGGQTADDLIVRDAWWLRSELGRNVFVVTQDQGLIGRVRRHRSPTAGSVQVLPSANFARLLGCPEDGAAGAKRRESTAERCAEASELAIQLQHLPGEGAPGDDPVLARYLRYVNGGEAPRATRPALDHTLVGAPPLPSTKRALRRKRGKHLLGR